MENNSKKDLSPVIISAGIVGITVVTLVVLGMFAFQQRPVEVAAAPGQTVATPTRAATATATPAPTASPTPTEVTMPTAVPLLAFDKTPAPADSAAVQTTSEVTTTTDASAAAAPISSTASLTEPASATAAVTTTAALTTAASVADVMTETTSAPAADSTAAVTATAPLTQAASPAASAPVDLAVVSAVVTKGTCGACHTIPGIDIAVGMIGPNLANIGTNAATRVAGYTAEAYLRESILNPNAFIAPECPTGACLPNLMLPNLADLLTPAEIDTIVNYLLTLKGQ